ncbi:hypothetical protein BT69DRAFT_1281267, partial [Atractiella rhizophila]
IVLFAPFFSRIGAIFFFRLYTISGTILFLSLPVLLLSMENPRMSRERNGNRAMDVLPIQWGFLRVDCTKGGKLQNRKYK